MSGLRVVRPGDRVPDVASGAMRREAAVSEALVGAHRIWMGYVELPPGAVSGAHHHGECESAIYLISGAATFLTGERLDERHAAGAGDVVWVPPHVVHVEANARDDEPVRMVVARSTQQTLVFAVDPPDGWNVEPGVRGP
jgi:uncharacterized RmlC-like cupin family protein